MINSPYVSAVVFGIFAAVLYYFSHRGMIRNYFIEQNKVVPEHQIENEHSVEQQSSLSMKGFPGYLALRVLGVFVVVAGSVFLGSQLVQQNYIDSFSDYPVKSGPPTF